MSSRPNVRRPWFIEDRICIGGVWTAWRRWGSTYATHEAAADVVHAYHRRYVGAAGPTQDIRISNRDEVAA